MTSLVDYILSLFRSEDAAQSFVADPGQAMTNAGLVNVSPVELSSVAASVVPGLALDAANPVAGLQQAVATQYGFAPTYDTGVVSMNAAQDSGAALVAGDAGIGMANVVA